MTPQSSRYTASGDLYVYAGEALAIELVILRDGVPIDPTGREGALTLWRTTNRVPILPPTAGETIDGTDATHGAVKLLRYVLPGSATDLVFTKHRTDCGYQIASANADGLDYRLIGKVLPKASASLGTVTGSGEPPVAALSLETRTQRIVVDARGAPGLSPWEALGITQAEYEASVRQPAVDAALKADADVAGAVLALGQAFAEQAMGVDEQLAAGLVAIDARIPGGPLLNGQWIKLPAIYKLRTTGIGSIALDARDTAGLVTPVLTLDVTSATSPIQYFHAGDAAVEIRATLTGSLTAEII